MINKLFHFVFYCWLILSGVASGVMFAVGLYSWSVLMFLFTCGLIMAMVWDNEMNDRGIL